MMKYVIHPRLVLEIHTGRARYQKYFENEYSKISTSSIQKDHVCIAVHIVNKLPDADGKESRHKVVNFKNIFSHEFVVRGLYSNKVEIFFKDTIFGFIYAKLVTLFLQAQVLEPIMYLKLLEQEIIFIHAAGISDGEFGYIFPAYGGTGKTTLTLRLMAEGYFVLGDDLLLVEISTKQVYPYLRPLHIFSYNINSLVGAKVPWFIRLKIKIKDVIRFFFERILKQEFLISTRVHANEIYKEFRVGNSVPYMRLIFLEKTGAHQKIKIRDENIISLAKKLLESADLNESLYKNILHPTEKNQVLKLEIEVMCKFLRYFEYFEVINTRSLDGHDIENLISHLASYSFQDVK